MQAASFGGTNIDPSAWEDKKCPGESRFPAQVTSQIQLLALAFLYFVSDSISSELILNSFIQN